MEISRLECMDSIPISKSYKYLGVKLEEYLNGEEMFTEVLDRSRKALYGLQRLSRNAGQIDFESFSRLYMSLVRSCLLYGCEVWGALYKNEINLERVQLSAIRSFLGVHSKFPLTALELEAGWTPIRWEVKLRAIKFWLRVERMDKSRLVKKIMKWGRGDNEWWQGIEMAGRSIGWSKLNEELFRGITTFEVENMMRASMERAIKNEWTERTKKKVKLKWWRWRMENVLDEGANSKYGDILRIKDKKTRKFLVELRAGCAKLEVETGRWAKKDRNDRICKLCKSGVEDEKHFLVDCTKLCEPRMELLNLIDSNPRDDTMMENVILMKAEENYLIAKKIMKMWTIRSDIHMK